MRRTDDRRPGSIDIHTQIIINFNSPVWALHAAAIIPFTPYYALLVNEIDARCGGTEAGFSPGNPSRCEKGWLVGATMSGMVMGSYSMQVSSRRIRQGSGSLQVFCEIIFYIL